MNKLKYFLVMVIAVLSLNVATAQTKKTTKTKTTTKTSTAAVKYQCPMKCEGDKTYAKAGKCPVCGMALAKVQTEATAKYQCPMKCEGDKTYTKAGKCPVCKMELAKLESKKDNQGHDGHNHN